MLYKKLVLVNMMVVIVTVAVLLFTSIRTFQRLCYEENSFAYQVAINEYYQTIENILTEGKESSLNLCVNSRLQEFLEENHSARYLDTEKTNRLNEMLAGFSRENGLYGVQVFPVNNAHELLTYDELRNTYATGGAEYGEYAAIWRGYRWEFRPDDQEIIRVTRQIYSDRDGVTVLGVIRVDMNVENILDVFWNFNMVYGKGTGSRLYLLDENGTVLLPYYSRDAETIVVEGESKPDALGYGSIIISRNISANRWKLVSQMENAELMAGSKEIMEQTLMLGGVLLVAGIGLTLILTKALTRPILKLARQMQNIQDIEVYEEIPVGRTRGEVRILYQSFNHLVSTVQRLVREIQLAAERRRRDEFRMLASQINPHFLYNTLGSIGWMAANQGATDLQEMTMDLVGMLRNGLNHGNIHILLRNEIEQVRCYVGIMKKRYPENYEFLFDIQEDTEDYWVIKQILQPLVENSIQYGLLENDGGSVTVRTYTDREELVLEVRNTGKLADLGKIDMLLRGDQELRSRHYGIRNVNERLQNRYGEQSGLRYSIQDGETVVTIRIPLEKVIEKPREEDDEDGQAENRDRG